MLSFVVVGVCCCWCLLVLWVVFVAVCCAVFALVV